VYFVSVVALMLVCPLISIGVQILLGGPGMLTAALVGSCASWESQTLPSAALR
jgi:hypothetical protein